MHPLYLFEMIGIGYIFIAAVLIVGLIVCIAITVTVSRISSKRMKAESEKEKADDVSDYKKRRHRKGRKNGKTG